MKRLALKRLLGSLLSPAEDPRGGRSAPADPAALLAELQRSRSELAELREALAPESAIALQLADEEEALREAERNLIGSMNEERARAAVLRARRRATEAELLSGA
jgi:hypothetical protein